jgi:hypothetical protein
MRAIALSVCPAINSFIDLSPTPKLEGKMIFRKPATCSPYNVASFSRKGDWVFSGRSVEGKTPCPSMNLIKV